MLARTREATGVSTGHASILESAKLHEDRRRKTTDEAEVHIGMTFSLHTQHKG